jgi:hypothetical protein
VLRKVTVVCFGFLWTVLAYFLLPEAIMERPVATLLVDELYRVFASVVTLVVGVVSCVLNYRNGRRRAGIAINSLRRADYLRTRGSWVQILPGAPVQINGLQRCSPFSFMR